MVDYKLIKKLPFEMSPEVGYISKAKEGCLHYWNHNWFNPEEYPEYWEKVEEKNYEILSLKYNKSNDFCYLDKRDGFYKYKNSFEELRTGKSNLEACLKANWSIHSVKRLSDGEVFTVGNNIENKRNPEKFNGKITEIKLTDYQDNVQVYYDGMDYLNDISHSKKPVFTTEDGVDIFEGDEVFHVYNNINMDRKIDSSIASETTKQLFLNRLFFSTREDAEEYILMNEPCLSIMDIKKTVFITEAATEIMKEKIRKKLNLY